MDDIEYYDYLFPETMMLPGEKRKAKGYLAIIENDHKAWLASQNSPPKNVPCYQRSAKCESAREKLEQLSAEILKRELGLELYMVLHIQREGGHEAKLQALEVDLMERYGSSRAWGWKVEGRALRKDGTIGSRNTGIGFGIARVLRRKLDGSWVCLVLAERNEPTA